MRNNPLKPTCKTEFVPVLLLLSAFLLSFYFYQYFPEQVAVHWNSAGQPDGYAGRFFAAFFFPVLNLAFYLLMLFIPALDPRKNSYQYFRPAYHLVKAGIIFFLWLIYLIMALKNIGYYIPVQIIVPFLVGALFVLIGLTLSRIKPNYFFGIRTPWTLRSPAVWQRTHRFGSRIFIIGGLLMGLLAVFSAGLVYFISLAIIIIISVVIYSYFIYSPK